MSSVLTLDQNLSYLGNFSSSVLHIPHNSFPYKKIMVEAEINVLTPQELGVCGESNEINGEKIVLCSTTEKKIVFF